MIAFVKMQSLGNDFVLMDARQSPFHLNPFQIQQLADRRKGVGCDQVLVLESSNHSDADFRYRIFNADGSEVEQCGNGARCVALYLYHHQQDKKKEWRLMTLGGLVRVRYENENKISVEMGIPVVEKGILNSLAIITLGNPHVVIKKPSLEGLHIQGESRLYLQDKERFPQGVNVGFMELINTGCIKLRVFERGVGETPACGSGACAAVVAGQMAGKLEKKVIVQQKGGEVEVFWPGPHSPVILTGDAQWVFEGQWAPSYLPLDTTK